MNVLIILGHPRRSSFCCGLAEAYERGARDVGLRTRFLALCDLRFERDVLAPSPRDQAPESDLLRAQALIEWADHLVFVLPVWWGSMPSLMKAFLDRALAPGFAFEHASEGSGWRPLLLGKTAHVLLTMDTPWFVYRWIYRAPTSNALKRATLEFCGVRPVRVRVYGPVIKSDAQRRRQWLADAYAQGRALAKGFPSKLNRRVRDAMAWVRALRLQFYPMSWAAYTMGALLARGPSTFSSASYWWGYVALFLLEVATVFINELVDFETDALNDYNGPFNGGARVLVSGAIERRPMQLAVALVLGAFAVATAIVCAATPAPLFSAGVFSTMAVLALSYTAPPAKFCYRGLGELDVAFTHSIGMILCGDVLMGGNLGEPGPWLLGLPLFLAILPSITLSGLPDRKADAIAGKGTLAVRSGATGAIFTAVIAAAAACAAAVLWPRLLAQGDIYRLVTFGAVPHAVILIAMCWRYLGTGAALRRIDGLMVVALSFILWFCVLPLWVLSRA